MARMVPDQTFYPSPAMAMSAPPETLAYVAMLNPGSGSDAIAVLDVAPGSKAFARQIGQIDMPGTGDELHHFGWNACSSCLCPFASHPHMERRYLVVPGLRSSRIHILDTKADAAAPRLIKTIEAFSGSQGRGLERREELGERPAELDLDGGARHREGVRGHFRLELDQFSLCQAIAHRLDIAFWRRAEDLVELANLD